MVRQSSSSSSSKSFIRHHVARSSDDAMQQCIFIRSGICVIVDVLAVNFPICLGCSSKTSEIRRQSHLGPAVRPAAGFDQLR